MMGVNNLCDAASNEILFSQNSLSKILFDLRWKDQSPLYFIVLHFWYFFFNFDPFWYRFLIMIFVLGTGFSLFKLSLYITEKFLPSLLTSFLFIISPLATWCVFSGRMYPITLLLVTLSALYLTRFLHDRKTSDIVLFILCNSLSIYNHFIGFWISGLFFLFWLTVEVASSLALKTSLKENLIKKLTPWLFAVSAVQTLVFPQILRMGSLMSSPPQHSEEWSISTSLNDYIDTVINFNFINAAWPFIVSNYASELRIILIAIISLLLIRGIYLLSPKEKFLISLFTMISVAVLYLTTTHLDIRDRYFIYLSPFAFLAIGSGLFFEKDTIDSNKNTRLTKWTCLLSRTSRCLAAALLIPTYLWMSLDKTQAKYQEYSRLTQLLDKIIPENTSFYSSRGYARGIPSIAAKGQNLVTEFSPVHDNYHTSEKIFKKDLEARKNFLFFLHGKQHSKEGRDRGSMLQKQKYNKILIDAYGASAELYTLKSPKKVLKPILKYATINPNPTATDMLKWIDFELKKRSFEYKNQKANLLTARIGRNGTIFSPLFISTQNGTDFEWNYMGYYWEKVKYTTMISSNIKKEVLWAHPIENSTLVISQPNTKIQNWLQIVHTIGVDKPYNNKVRVDVYFDTKKVATFSSSNRLGWLSKEIPTLEWHGKNIQLTFLITCELQTYAHFGFNYTHHDSEPTPVSNKSWKLN